MGDRIRSSVVPTFSISFKSVPKTLMPIGVRMPVVSMSTRVLMGIVKALVHPGSCSFWFISDVSSSQVLARCSGQTGRSTFLIGSGAQLEYQRSCMTGRHCSDGLSRTVVSTIVSGAGSVGVSARPTLPNTLSTSGKLFRTRSWTCSCLLASSMEMFGNVIGMYRMSPSFSGGMNSCPSFLVSATAEMIANRPIAIVEMGRLSARYTKGLYRPIMNRDTGCFASGKMRPRIKKSRRAGANVMDSTAAASITNVLVYARGLNSLPAWPVRPNTGKNATAIISSEKKIAGVTSRAASASSR